MHWGNPLVWMCLAAFVPYALFVGFYAARSPWHASPVGRSLMLSKVVIVLLLGHVLVLASVGPYENRLGVWAVLFGATAVAGTTQLVMLLKLQRKRSNGDHPLRRSTDHP